MICSNCTAHISNFSVLQKIGRTHGMEVRACVCGAPLAAPIVRRQRKPAKKITASSSRAYRLCPRKYQRSYIQGLRPLVEADALRFGSLIHLGLAAWWSAPRPDRLTLALKALEGGEPFDVAKATAMLAGYDARWAFDADLVYDVLSVEQAFAVPLYDGRGRRVRGWECAGKVDALLRERATSRTVVLEHKTTSTDLAAGGDYWQQLQLDGQCSIYLDAMAAESVLYDVLRKPGAKPLLATPEDKRRVTKSGELDKRQRLTDETPDEYRERLVSLIAERPQEHYGRATVVRLETERVAARDDLAQTVRMIKWSEKHNAWPRNDHACFQYGSRCAYWPLCSGTGSESEYRKIEDVHPELLQEVAQ